MYTKRSDLQLQSGLLLESLAGYSAKDKGRRILERLREEIQQRKDAGIVCQSQKDCEGKRPKCEVCWDWENGKLNQ